MADDDKTQGAQVGEGSDSKVAEGAAADGDDRKSAAVPGAGPDDPITPGRLKAVLGKRDKDLQERIEASTAPILESQRAMQESLAALAARFEEQSKAADDKDKDKKKEKVDVGEVLKLREEMQDLQGQLTKEREKRQQAERLRSDEAFERKIKDGLVDEGVMPTRLDRVYRAIKDDFDREQYEKDGTIVAPFEDPELGKSTLELRDYIRQVIRLKDMPECFSGGSRTGADAGGDAIGPDGRKYAISRKEILDMDTYVEKRKEIHKALDDGTVEPPEGKSVVGLKAFGKR